MRVLFKAKINDWLIWCLIIYTLLSDIFALLSFNVFLLIFILPLAILNIFFFPIAKATIIPQFVIYEDGIKVKRKLLSWKEVKSISFESGRFKDSSFWTGVKLPAIQRIYVLDKTGKEHSAIIDIDHIMKINRGENNLNRINNMLHTLGRANLISDWAEKR